MWHVDWSPQSWQILPLKNTEHFIKQKKSTSRKPSKERTNWRRGKQSKISSKQKELKDLRKVSICFAVPSHRRSLLVRCLWYIPWPHIQHLFLVMTKTIMAATLRYGRVLTCRNLQRIFLSRRVNQDVQQIQRNQTFSSSTRSRNGVISGINGPTSLSFSATPSLPLRGQL